MVAILFAIVSIIVFRVRSRAALELRCESASNLDPTRLGPKWLYRHRNCRFLDDLIGDQS
jgi:hypothetical protein